MYILPVFVFNKVKTIRLSYKSEENWKYILYGIKYKRKRFSNKGYERKIYKY